jgi:hypothetical protein
MYIDVYTQQDANMRIKNANWTETCIWNTLLLIRYSPFSWRIIPEIIRQRSIVRRLEIEIMVAEHYHFTTWSVYNSRFQPFHGSLFQNYPNIGDHWIYFIGNLNKTRCGLHTNRCKCKCEKGSVGNHTPTEQGLDSQRKFLEYRQFY